MYKYIYLIKEYCHSKEVEFNSTILRHAFTRMDILQYSTATRTL